MHGTEGNMRRKFPTHEFAASMTPFGERWSAGHEGSSLDDQFIRPAIIMSYGTLSIDLVTGGGDLIARLNISRTIDTEFMNIDIIPNDDRRIKLASWDNGARVFTYTLPKGKLVSVDLSKNTGNE